MQEHYQILEWDSRFFDLKIAQVEQNILSVGNDDLCLKKLAEANVNLAYYNTDTPLQETSNKYFDFFLVNKKVPIKKKIGNSSPIHENISFYNEPEPNEQLINLAQRAGAFSRFLKDPNIDPIKVKELYEEWIVKSVKKEMASEVLVYKKNSKIEGFVTLKINPPVGETPLFAVSREVEGKGASFALMRAADSVLYDNGCSYYTSATQAENKAALTVFNRHGFEIKPVEYTYHLWRK